MRVLPIAKLKDVDKDFVPTTGEEYLYIVQQEAKSINYSNSQSALYENESPIQTLLHSDLTLLRNEKQQVSDENWENEYVLNFSKLRLALQLNKKRYRIKYPKNNNKNEWYEWIYNKNGENGFLRYPTTRRIKGLNQQQLLMLLSCHTEWIAEEIEEDHEMNLQRIKYLWIFSILMKIDKLLEADEVFILRELCRKCTIKLQNQDAESLKFQPELKLIILIISVYFGQRDLKIQNKNQ